MVLTRVAHDSRVFHCGNQAQRYMRSDIQIVCRNSKKQLEPFLDLCLMYNQIEDE